MSKPIQTYFPELPPPLIGGEGSEVEGGCRAGSRSKKATTAGKSAALASGLPAVLSVVRFLRWFADRRYPCLVCGRPVDESEYLALYRPEPTEPVLAVNAAHANCREAEKRKRAEAPCGCAVLLPTMVRVVACSDDHEIGTVDSQFGLAETRATS